MLMKELREKKKEIKDLLDAKFGSNGHRFVDTPRGVIFVRKPERLEYERYTDKMAADSNKYRQHILQLIRACLIEELSPEEMLEACITDEPSLPGSIAGHLHEMAGDNPDRLSGKL